MTKSRRSWDLLSEEERRLAIKKVVDFFEKERNEEIGVIAAESILDMVLQCSAIKIYNKGVNDAQNFIKGRLGEIEIDMEATLKLFDK